MQKYPDNLSKAAELSVSSLQVNTCIYLVLLYTLWEIGDQILWVGDQLFKVVFLQKPYSLVYISNKISLLRAWEILPKTVTQI